MAPDKSDSKEVKLNYSDTTVVFSNHVAITKVSNEEVEIAICVKGPDESVADVKQRLIVTLPHFFRIKELFSLIATDIEKQLGKESEK